MMSATGKSERARTYPSTAGGGVPTARPAAIPTTSRRLCDVIGARRWDFFKGNDVTDLSKLTDDELELLERLLAKAAGELLDGDVVPTIRIERVFVDTAEPTADANYVER
jgi:hypothetical protein